VCAFMLTEGQSASGVPLALTSTITVYPLFHAMVKPGKAGRLARLPSHA